MTMGLNVYAAIYPTIGQEKWEKKKKKPKNLNLICNEDIQDLETKLSMASNPLNQSIQESDAVNVKAVKH